MSLYDYLGKPAGGKMGAEVYNYARLRKIPMEIRKIENPKYKGKVMLYPEEFLNEYFKIKS
jgi:hypothetical protein